MKSPIEFLLITFSMLHIANAQQVKPELLKEPATWHFETFPLPPDFAPGIHYKGVEELRFSPGMFKKDSADYFSYAFAARIDSLTTISQNDIRAYLLSYFKGLCSSTATERKLIIDTSKISVSIEKSENLLDKAIVYNALLNVFGVFADGAPVKLNMEVKVLNDVADKDVYLIFITSPRPKSDPVWKELYQIQKDFTIPVQ